MNRMAGDFHQRKVSERPSAGKARPNVYTAMALLSKVYLYRKQYELSANLASRVINSNTYGLEPDLNNVFLDGSNEAIWQLPARPCETIRVRFSDAPGVSARSSVQIVSVQRYGLSAPLVGTV